MEKKFDIHNRHKLDNEKRREVLPPSQTLVNLGLKEGDIIADIGCGIGYFSIPAGEIVGDEGKVFALDISLEMLEELDKKIDSNSISNIKTIVTEENNFKIDDMSVNFAFICNVLHEAENTEVFLKEAKRILNEDGKLVVVEWKKEESDYGPPVNHRLSYKEARNKIEDCGFKNIDLKEIGRYFYAIVAKK